MASRSSFIHGFPTSSHIWRDVVPLVPPGHRVVVVDLLGYGRSDRPESRDLSIKAHAERVLALLDVLRISYATVIGHDLGGGIAQYLAVHHPTRVARLGLVSSVAFDSWPTREVRLVKATLPLTRYLPAMWVASVLRSDLLRGYSDAQRGGHSVDMYILPFEGAEGRDTLVEHLAALDPDETEALAPRLKDIVAPTAIITGAHDPFLGIAVAEQLHAVDQGLDARGDLGRAALRSRAGAAARGGHDHRSRRAMSSRLETFRAMVAQHPDNVLARFGLANEALKEGLHAEAAEQLRAYLAAYDDEGNGFGRLALALEKLGRVDEAKDALHAGIAAARRFGHPRWRRSSRRDWRSSTRGERRGGARAVTAL